VSTNPIAGIALITSAANQIAPFANKNACHAYNKNTYDMFHL
jgi:hypothetical protein